MRFPVYKSTKSILRALKARLQFSHEKLYRSLKTLKIAFYVSRMSQFEVISRLHNISAIQKSLFGKNENAMLRSKLILFCYKSLYLANEDFKFFISENERMRILFLKINMH